MSSATSAQVILNEIEAPKSPLGTFELPCGYLDPEGQLHTEVVVREITGEEEDILGSRKVSESQKMNELLKRCVVRLGPTEDRQKINAAVSELTVGDRAFLIFAIRRVTLGDLYPFTTTCPECEVENDYQINLDELETKAPPDPRARVYDRTLPKSGKSIRLRIMNGELEERLSKLAKKQPEDTLSLSLWVRVELLDGKPATLQDLKRLGMADRTFVRELVQEVEGGVDTTMELTCPSCGHDYEREIDLRGRGFFFPSATRKS